MGSIEDMPELLELPSGEDVAGDVMERDTLARLKCAMDSLPAERRRVIELIYHEGLSREAVAERVGVSASTIKAWLRADLETLRGTLDP